MHVFCTASADVAVSGRQIFAGQSPEGASLRNHAICAYWAMLVPHSSNLPCSTDLLFRLKPQSAAR